MDGIQETVALGLRVLAQKVEDGNYGRGDDAFDDDNDQGGAAQVFLNDIHDEVLEKMQ